MKLNKEVSFEIEDTEEDRDRDIIIKAEKLMAMKRMETAKYKPDDKLLS